MMMRAQLESVASLARRLLAWWVGELVSLLPARARSSARRGARLEFAVDDRTTLFHRSASRSRVLGTWPLNPTPLNGEGEIVDSLRKAGLLGQLRRGRLPIVARLPARDVLRAVVRLPLAADENLREVIAHEMDRQTPFEVERVDFAFRVIERDADTRQMNVEVTVATKRAIAIAVAALRRLGVDANGVVAEADRPDDPSSGYLLPFQVAGAERRRRRLATVALAACFLLLAGAAVWMPIAESSAQADRLSERLKAARRAAQESAGLQKEIDGLLEDRSFLIDRKRRAPTASEVLNETTRLVPDGDWLTELHISGDELQLSGFAVSSFALVGALERSPFFKGASFRSPVTRDAKTERERFSIRTTVRSLPADVAPPAPPSRHADSQSVGPVQTEDPK
jgi:general secretion pathway protein L